MFVIIFERTQALLLSMLRSSWPRISRGKDAERLRNMDCLWPQTRPGHGHGPVQCRPRTQTVRVHEQSASASCPRQQPRSQTVRKHGLATDSIVRDRATTTVADFPPTVRSRGLSPNANWPRPRFVRSRDRQSIVPVPASPRPHRRPPVSRFIFNQFPLMTTFDPAQVRKAVAEFTPRRPQKFQVVDKPLPAVTNARIVPLRLTNRALVTSLHFLDSNKSGGLPSALGGGRCAPLADHRPKPDNSHKRESDKFVNH